MVFLIKIVKYILENISCFVTERDRNKLNWLSLNNNHIPIVAVISGLSFAFSITFWEQATRVEVYSLQLFLTSIIIYFGIKGYISIKKNSKRFLAEISFAIFLGLAFSNHLMTIYLIPSLIYLFFKGKNINKKNLVLFFELGFISFFIAVFFYLIMMFRAQTNPPYMFGDPSSISTMIAHGAWPKNIKILCSKD